MQHRDEPRDLPGGGEDSASNRVMNDAPDIVQVPLVPNEDDRHRDPAEVQRLMAALPEHLRRRVEALGIRLATPGEIDPFTQRNPERESRIRETTNPRLDAASADFRRSAESGKMHVRVEHTNADGSSTKVDISQEYRKSSNELNLGLQKIVGLCECVGIKTGEWLSIAFKLIAEGWERSRRTKTVDPKAVSDEPDQLSAASGTPPTGRSGMAVPITFSTSASETPPAGRSPEE